jgi:cupin fold WbuC family metalloprotein
MTEPILWNDRVLAYVMRGTMTPEKTIFPTPPELELQVGFVVYPAGGVIHPHRHVPITRSIERTCEVIVVRKGRCEIDLYNDDRQVVATRELSTGDLIMIVSGGHGFRMMEDTILLEVKQGPYQGLGEKEQLS